MAFQMERDTQILDVLTNAPETEMLFTGIGMHCLGCAMAHGETVEEACAAHGVDVEAFIAKANEIIRDFAS